MSIENNPQNLSPLIIQANNLVAKISNSRLWVSSKDVSALDAKIQEIAQKIIPNQPLDQEIITEITSLISRASNLKKTMFGSELKLQNLNTLKETILPTNKPLSKSTSTASLTETESLSSEEDSCRSTVTEQDLEIAKTATENPDIIVKEEVASLIENKEISSAAKLLETRPLTNQISILTEISQNKPECIPIFIEGLIDQNNLKLAGEFIDKLSISSENKEHLLSKLMEKGGALVVVDLLTKPSEIKNNFIKKMFDLNTRSTQQEITLGLLLPDYENIKYIIQNAGTENLNYNELREMLKNLDYDSLEFLTDHIQSNIKEIDSNQNQSTRAILQSLRHSLDSLSTFAQKEFQKSTLFSTLLTKSLITNPDSTFLQGEMNLWKRALEGYKNENKTTDSKLEELGNMCLMVIDNLPSIVEAKKEKAISPQTPSPPISTETPRPSLSESSQKIESSSVAPSQSSEASTTNPKEVLSKFIGKQSVLDLFFTLIDPENIESSMVTDDKLVIKMKGAQQKSITQDLIGGIIEKQNTTSKIAIKTMLRFSSPVLSVPESIEVEKSNDQTKGNTTLLFKIAASAPLIGTNGLKAVTYNQNDNKGTLTIAKPDDLQWIDNADKNLSINF